MGKLLSFPGRQTVTAQEEAFPAEALDLDEAPTPQAEPAVGRLCVRSVVKSFK